ncbi:MAG: hypothetical protein ACETWG_05550 [Candidatus Neomarinimicrobiota bacterium]
MEVVLKSGATYAVGMNQILITDAPDSTFIYIIQNGTPRLVSLDSVQEVRVIIAGPTIYNLSELAAHRKAAFILDIFFSQQKGKQVTITTSDDRSYSGVLMCSTDTLLLLWEDEDPFRWQGIREFTNLLPVSQIERVTVENEAHYRTGIISGLFLGGILGSFLGTVGRESEANRILYGWEAKTPFTLIYPICSTALASFSTRGAIAGSILGCIVAAINGCENHFSVQGDSEKYRSLLLWIRENALFSDPPYPLVHLLSGEKGERPVLSSVAQAESVYRDISKPKVPFSDGRRELRRSLAAQWASRFHISYGLEMWWKTDAMSHIKSAFLSSGLGGRALHFKKREAPISWSLELAYSLTPRLRVGFSHTDLSWWEEVHACFDSYEGIGCLSSTGLHLNLVLRATSPLREDPWEFTVGSGLSTNLLSVKGRLAGYSTAYAHDYSVRTNVIGIHLRCSIDYYLSRHVSIWGSVEQRFTSPMVVPEQSVETNQYGKLTMEEHTIRLSGAEAALALRFHF